MAKYTLRLTVASDYNKGWIYSNPPVEEQEYSDPVICNNNLDQQANKLVMLASTHSAAARYQVLRIDGAKEEVIREQVYDGEQVYFWFAAYKEHGQSEIEDRWYIQRVYVQLGYYAFVHNNNRYKGVEITGCCTTLEELEENLGKEFHLYEIKS